MDGTRGLFRPTAPTIKNVTDDPNTAVIAWEAEPDRFVLELDQPDEAWSSGNGFQMARSPASILAFFPLLVFLDHSLGKVGDFDELRVG